MSDHRTTSPYTTPAAIEGRSFEIIRAELKERGADTQGLTRLEEEVLVRVIHATADFDFADTLAFAQGASEQGLKALSQGCTVCCDTTMVAAGINKRALARLRCEAKVFVADPDVAAEAKERQVTRSVVAMERTLALPGVKIVVVGNAPTALIRLADHLAAGAIAPALTVAVPVGFVNVIESKEAIEATGAPSIIARGRKGGSTVAVAIMNALIYAATGDVRS